MIFIFPEGGVQYFPAHLSVGAPAEGELVRLRNPLPRLQMWATYKVKRRTWFPGDALELRDLGIYNLPSTTLFAVIQIEAA